MSFCEVGMLLVKILSLCPFCDCRSILWVLLFAHQRSKVSTFLLWFILWFSAYCLLLNIFLGTSHVAPTVINMDIANDINSIVWYILFWFLWHIAVEFQIQLDTKFTVRLKLAFYLHSDNCKYHLLLDWHNICRECRHNLMRHPVLLFFIYFQICHLLCLLWNKQDHHINRCNWLTVIADNESCVPAKRYCSLEI
jgi:hypothetical protein